MPRGLKAWKGQLIDPESGNRFPPGSPGYKKLVQMFPEETAQVLSGNSTPRRSEAKERAASDNYESAFVGLSPRIAKDIDITSRYFV